MKNNQSKSGKLSFKKKAILNLTGLQKIEIFGGDTKTSDCGITISGQRACNATVQTPNSGNDRQLPFPITKF